MVKRSSYSIIWDRKALDHFKDILAYLRSQSEQAPRIVKAAIVARLDLLRTNPLISEPDKLKDPSNRDFRAFVVFSYRVTYQINANKRRSAY